MFTWPPFDLLKKKMAGWMDGLQTSSQEQLALVLGEGQSGDSISTLALS